MANEVRTLRKAQGWSIRELAERMSTEDKPVHFTTVAKIERSDRKLTHEWAQRFAETFGVPVETVYGEPAPAGGTVARRIAVIGMVAAGNWREAVHHADEFIPAPIDAPNAFALRVAGDSMDRLAPDGAYALVNPDEFNLRDGQYYVVMNGEGETTFKQYRADPARLEPSSSNPNHQTLTLGREQFTVVGRVEGVYRKLS